MNASTAPRLRTALRAALAPPGLALVPILMLPLAIGGAGLAIVGPEAAVQGRAAVLFGAAAMAWYLLGGVLSLARLRARRAARRALAQRLPDLSEAPGELWATDADGYVLWQNDATRRAAGEHDGAAGRRLLERLAADPDGLAADLAHRAGRFGAAEAAVARGRLKLAELAGGALRVWHLLPDGPAAPAAGEGPAVAAGERADRGAVFDRLPAALLKVAADRRITAANRAALALLGPVPEGASLATLLDGLGRPVDDWVDDTLHGRIEPQPEVLRRRGAEGERHLQVALAPDGEGGLYAMLSDASAMKTLEAQFVQSQKMQAIGQLAGGIAHDFNNLLTAISGHCDLLMLRRDKTDPDFADLDQISQNANRAAALVGQLLAFSRKQTLKPRLLDLRDTLSDLTHLMNRLVGERIALTFEHDSALRPIRADRRQFEQVVVNLVVNARDAMPHGGRITIRTANLARGARPAPAQLPRGDYVRVTVEDEGCGIAPDKLDKIFEPFFTTKRTGEGTGLGLSTVYGIVKQTGGYVFCDSVPGRGTVFSLYFPAHDPAELAAAEAEEAAAEGEARAARAVPAPAQPLRRGHVLLVEDEAAVRAFAGRALRLRGFEVLEADSAEAALELLAGDPREIDVFVTDVVMPGLDGPSWVRSALRDRPATRVLFISGYAEDIFEDGRAAIANASFLQKPFSLTDLAEAVTRLVAAGADTPAPAPRSAAAAR